MLSQIILFMITFISVNFVYFSTGRNDFANLVVIDYHYEVSNQSGQINVMIYANFLLVCSHTYMYV